MTLIKSLCNVLPEELPVRGSPNMPVLFRDALSGITIKLQRWVIAPKGCKSNLTLPRLWNASAAEHFQGVGSECTLYIARKTFLGAFFFNAYIFLLKDFLLTRAANTECKNN